MADTKLIHPTLGWSIVYQGYRTADIYTPDGTCWDLVQVRPWDWTRSPSDQDPYDVTDSDLLAHLEQYLSEYLSDTGQTSLA